MHVVCSWFIHMSQFEAFFWFYLQSFKKHHIMLGFSKEQEVPLFWLSSLGSLQCDITVFKSS